MDAKQYFESGKKHFGVNNFHAAEKAYTAAIKLNGKVPDYYFYRALVNDKLEKYDKAILDFDKAIELFPRFHKALCRRARLKYFLKDFFGAIKDLNAAIIIKNDYTEAFVILSMCKTKIGDREGAEADYKTAILLGFVPPKN